MMSFIRTLALILIVGAPGVHAKDLVLGPDVRAVPGEAGPEYVLRYGNPQATNVVLAGSWSHWLDKLHPLQKKGELWEIDIQQLGLSFGQHTYKFIVDGEWESGSDRVLYVNEDGLLERPLDLITSARVVNRSPRPFRARRVWS